MSSWVISYQQLFHLANQGFRAIINFANFAGNSNEHVWNSFLMFSHPCDIRAKYKTFRDSHNQEVFKIFLFLWVSVSLILYPKLQNI